MLKKVLVTLSVLDVMVSVPQYSFAEQTVPLDAKLEYNQGVDYYKLGLYDKATASFRQAISLCPDYIDAYYNLATILDYTNQHSEALVALKQILLRKPNDYESVYKAAQISSKLGDIEKVKSYASIIPPASEYHKPAQALLEKLEVKLTVQIVWK